ncbi:hypothetical protein ORI89_05765 [Sphingobacterium sp. UT-1RO-CII-1]|uniref:ComEC/Rec2 family competence protein n=1 Tax=Sphingobacterium sp. UT-1RO-CII-1 TaxID=2995225 RepID=UPI00227CD951|nr:hypothetical protein [Sphingobacterium sp. UT-1RO-CII-1]MCY4779147.1 hypothetical protein [Sphingobacterium sp. UT-1RO-CII-1]
MKKISTKLGLYILFVFFGQFHLFGQSDLKKNKLPDWQPGYLDIHQIATGRGNAALWILPDATTMVVDVGDLGDTSNFSYPIMPLLPNKSKTVDEWIIRYINHFTASLGKKNEVDYMFLTHHHDDHDGAFERVSESMKISRLVDRSWPSYDYPSRVHIAKARPNLDNYIDAVKRVASNGTKVSAFHPGRKQFKLLNQPNRYRHFEIRNISGSGKIWTGKGTKVRNLFPELHTINENDYPDENMVSSTLLVQYGKFRYFAGADITGLTWAEAPYNRDVETPVGNIVGLVDVALMNHHGYSDSHNRNYLASLQPRVFVNPVWDFFHPQPEILSRILDQEIFPGERLIFATGMVAGNVERLGKLAENIHKGHIVLRVYPEGEKYQIFVLDSSSLDYPVIYQTQILKAGR